MQCTIVKRVASGSVQMTVGGSLLYCSPVPVHMAAHSRWLKYRAVHMVVQGPGIFAHACKHFHIMDQIRLIPWSPFLHQWCIMGQNYGSEFADGSLWCQWLSVGTKCQAPWQLNPLHIKVRTLSTWQLRPLSTWQLGPLCTWHLGSSPPGSSDHIHLAVRTLSPWKLGPSPTGC